MDIEDLEIPSLVVYSNDVIPDADDRHYPFASEAAYNAALPKYTGLSEYPYPVFRTSIRGTVHPMHPRPYVVASNELLSAIPCTIWEPRASQRTELRRELLWERLRESGLGRYAAILYTGAVGLIVPVATSHLCACSAYYLVRTVMDPRTLLHSWIRVQAVACGPLCARDPDATIEQEIANEMRDITDAIDLYIADTVVTTQKMHCVYASIARADVPPEGAGYIYAGWNECRKAGFIHAELPLRPTAPEIMDGMRTYMMCVPNERSPVQPDPRSWLTGLDCYIPSHADSIPEEGYLQSRYWYCVDANSPQSFAVRELDARCLKTLISNTDPAAGVACILRALSHSPPLSPSDTTMTIDADAGDSDDRLIVGRRAAKREYDQMTDEPGPNDDNRMDVDVHPNV